MEWLMTLKNTLRYIETNLCDEINMGTMAREVYLSPFYLQKGFQIITGYSVGEYIRNRRLYEAARELVKNEEKVIDIALRYGYETPESFTKAFTRFHGASPSVIRRQPERIRVFLPLNIRIEITGGSKMNYTVSPMFGFRVIGFERVFSYENACREIPAFWDEICEKYCTHTIYAGLAPSCPEEQAIVDNCIGEYGVCIDDLGNGKFRYLIAGRYTGGVVPEGMTLFEFPQGEWAKFECVGPIPQALQELNTRVFREWLPGNPEYQMAGCYNVEWYSCDGEKTDDDYRSAIWIPVTRYSEEAERRYGDTAEYRENLAKTAGRSKKENDAVSEGLMRLFGQFGALCGRGAGPDSPEAQEQVSALKDYISENYYACSDEVLSGLGEMYVGDERFRTNIDRRGGAGTAEFASRAIAVFCKK